MLGHYWLDMESTEFFVTEDDLRKNPEKYNKNNIN